jgi:hypothetical protein
LECVPHWFCPDRTLCSRQSCHNEPQPAGAYTFLSMQTGTEVSVAVGMTFNLVNTATNYQSDDELHVEAALNQHFPFGLAAGVGGYFYQQITGDYGSGDRVGPFRGRVAGIGPLLAYTFKADKQEVTLSGRREVT